MKNILILIFSLFSLSAFSQNWGNSLGNVEDGQGTEGFANKARLGYPYMSVATPFQNDRKVSGGAYSFILGNMTDSLQNIFDFANKRLGLGISPTARLHVKGNGATSSTANFLLQNSSNAALFRVLDDGQVVFPGSVSTARIFTTAGDANISNIGYGMNMVFESSYNMDNTGGANFWFKGAASGTNGVRGVGIATSYAASSGAGAYSAFYLTPTFTQTGSASGTMTGLDYNPSATVLGIHNAAWFRSGMVTIGATQGTRSLDVNTHARIRGDIYNVGDSTGTTGQIIVKRGTGWGWRTLVAGDISDIGTTLWKLGGNDGTNTFGSNTGSVHIESDGTRRMTIPEAGIANSPTSAKALVLNNADSLGYKTLQSDSWTNTATLANSASVDTILNSGAGYGHFQQVGNIVFFTVRIEIGIDNSGDINVAYISPPVASNFTTEKTDVIATAKFETQNAPGGNIPQQRCFVYASTGDDKIAVSYDPVAALAYPSNRHYLTVSGSYIVIP